MTDNFKQLVKNNEGYTVFDDEIKPEPINPTYKAAAVAPAPVKKNKTYTAPAQGQYKSKKSRYYKKPYYTKPTRTKRRRYSGAKRRSAHYGYAGQQRSTHRRR